MIDSPALQRTCILYRDWKVRWMLKVGASRQNICVPPNNTVSIGINQIASQIFLNSWIVLVRWQQRLPGVFVYDRSHDGEITKN